MLQELKLKYRLSLLCSGTLKQVLKIKAWRKIDKIISLTQFLLFR